MPTWVAILVALIGAVAAVVAGRAAVRVKRLESKETVAEQAQRLTAEAFDRARQINTEIVDQLRDEIERLRHELSGLRDQAARLGRRNAELENRHAAMERSLARMNGLVAQYARQLRDLGVDVASVDGH